MSLRLDMTEVNRDELRKNYPPSADGSMNPVTYAIMVATMGVGIGHISEADAPEFYARLHIYENLIGSLLRMPTSDGGLIDRSITAADVRAHIGLRTNVAKETRASWYKRVVTTRLNDAIHVYNNSAREEARA